MYQFTSRMNSYKYTTTYSQDFCLILLYINTRQHKRVWDKIKISYFFAESQTIEDFGHSMNLPR
jgi:hypothetical protein